MKYTDGHLAAFPVQAESVQAGITAREWFAGIALQGYLAMSASGSLPVPSPKTAAACSFQYADAMLAASKKPSVGD